MFIMYYRQFLSIALHSLWFRKVSIVLSVLAIALSVYVFVSIEHVRSQARSNFSKTVSGVDLIVGARSSDIGLLLYSVFHLGDASNNFSWQSFKKLQQQNDVAWAVPIALGDSHQGYKVVGTSADYFEYFYYGDKRSLEFQKGERFNKIYDVVLGAYVAKVLGYQIDDEIVLAHGIAKKSFSLHDDKPFRVVGILKPTGTPVDQSLYVSLAAIEAIHVGWQSGVKLPKHLQPKHNFDEALLVPKSITAAFIGLRSKFATFTVQRQINNARHEPLSAVLPGVALAKLWQSMNQFERVLQLVSLLVLLSALLGLCAVLLMSMQERKKEFWVFRSIGASRTFIILLIQLEAVLVTLVAIALALFMAWLTFYCLSDMLLESYGLLLDWNVFQANIAGFLAATILATVLIAVVPSFWAYKLSGYAL